MIGGDAPHPIPCSVRSGRAILRKCTLIACCSSLWGATVLECDLKLMIFYIVGGRGGEHSDLHGAVRALGVVHVICYDSRSVAGTIHAYMSMHVNIPKEWKKLQVDVRFRFVVCLAPSVCTL